MPPLRTLISTVVPVIALGLCGWVLLASADAAKGRVSLGLPVASAESAIEFFGFDVPGTDFVWCLDLSNSMSSDGDLAIVKAEMIDALSALTPAHQFSIVTFASGVISSSPTLVEATPDQIESAIEFVDGLSASGSSCLTNGVGVALDIAELSANEASVIIVGDGADWCVGATSATAPAATVAAITAQNPGSIPIHCFHRSADNDAGVPTYQAIASAFAGLFIDTQTSAATGAPALRFVRADANFDGNIDISDVVVILQVLFQGGASPCMDAVDANDDGAADVSDAVYTLSHLFDPSGTPPPPPYPGCGSDPTCDLLDCAEPVDICAAVDFDPRPPLETSTLNSDLLAGDFDGDGIPDIAALGAPIRTHRGLGGGSFTDLQEFGLTTHVYYDGVLGDLDGDGVRDLATLSRPVGLTTRYLSVFTGAADGTFTALSFALTDEGATVIETADLNGDGILDLVTNSVTGNNVLVHLGVGGGFFSAPSTLPLGGSPVRLQILDANLDGFLDVASYQDSPAAFVVLFGDGSGGFAAPVSTTVLGTLVDTAFDRLNGDGFPDAVLLTEDAAGAMFLEVWPGDGFGGFAPSTSRPVVGSTYRLRTGDFNLDGSVDVVTLLQTDVMELFANNGNATFRSEIAIPLQQSILAIPYFVVVDYDGDGDLDVGLRRASNFIRFAENQLIP